MKETAKALEIIKSSASGILGIVTGYYAKRILWTDPDNSVMLVVALAVFLFLAVAVVHFLADRLIANATWLRRILFGKRFIEGVWLQRVESESLNTRPALYSLLVISFEDDKLKVAGQSFDHEGRFTANFHSACTEFMGFELKYPFEAQTLQNKERKIFGITKLVFTQTLSEPDNYIGYVASNLRDQSIMVSGRRIALTLAQAPRSVDERVRLISFLNDDKERPIQLETGERQAVNSSEHSTPQKT